MSPHHRWILCVALLAALMACPPPQSICARTTCPAGEECNPATLRCEKPAGDAGQACTSQNDCAAPTPFCAPGLGVCAECLGDDDCRTGLCDSASFACIAQPDTCQTARPIDLSSGQVTLRGNTARAADDTAAVCAMPGSTGADLVYTFTLADSRRILARAAPLSGSPLRPVLALRSACAATDLASSLGCSYLAQGEAEARLSAELTAGTFWLWVEGDGDSAGQFELTVTAEVAPSGDTCSRPTAMVPFGSSELLGDTRQAKNDDAASCGGLEAPDRVYELGLLEASRVTAELVALTPGYLPLLYMRRAPCESAQLASELGCARAGPLAAQGALLDVPRLDPGSYYFFIDGDLGPDAKPTAGEFKLKVSFAPPLGTPANDECTGAEPIDPPVGGLGTVSVTGTTGFAVNDSAGCGGTGPDVVYSLRLPGPRRLKARVAPSAGSALVPIVYLRKPGACDSELAQDQLDCNIALLPGSPASVNAPNLPAGNYFIWVDGAGQSKGAFELSLELGEALSAPANDTCATPQVIYPAAGPVTVTGSTTGATSDALLGCQVPPAGADVVYQIEVPTRQSLALELQALTSSQLKPIVALRGPGACSSNLRSDEMACVWADPQFRDRAVFNVPALNPGSYFLWVQGDQGTHGPYSLRTSLGLPVAAPLNDDCLAVTTPLLAGTVVNGDTRAAVNDTAGSCNGPPGTSGEFAGEVVYGLTLASAKTVTLTVTPDANNGKLLRPVIYVRGPGATACGSKLLADQKGCEVATGYGLPVSLTLQSLAAGSYWVWVDGAGQSTGKFTLKMQ